MTDNWKDAHDAVGHKSLSLPGTKAHRSSSEHGWPRPPATRTHLPSTPICNTGALTKRFFTLLRKGSHATKKQQVSEPSDHTERLPLKHHKYSFSGKESKADSAPATGFLWPLRCQGVPLHRFGQGLLSWGGQALWLVHSTAAEPAGQQGEGMWSGSHVRLGMKRM